MHRRGDDSHANHRQITVSIRWTTFGPAAWWRRRAGTKLRRARTAAGGGDAACTNPFRSTHTTARQPLFTRAAAARAVSVWQTCCSVLGSGWGVFVHLLEPICIHSLSACTFPLLAIIYLKHYLYSCIPKRKAEGDGCCACAKGCGCDGGGGGCVGRGRGRRQTYGHSIFRQPGELIKNWLSTFIFSVLIRACMTCHQGKHRSSPTYLKCQTPFQHSSVHNSADPQ